MIKARLNVRLADHRTAISLIKSIQPDNQRMKGLRINSAARQRDACFKITYGGRIETFISTMEDMLRCIQAAERTLQGVAREEK